ncbi:MAG TPA: radical SAM protein [Bacillota bacterium]
MTPESEAAAPAAQPIHPRLRVSAGTAAAIGLDRLKVECLPTTAYLMTGERCDRNCGFCPQARESGARADLLSRVTWPDADPERVVEAIASSYDQAGRGGEGVKRVCLQVVHDRSSLPGTLEAVRRIRSRSAVPICVSVFLNDPDLVAALFEAGADRVTMPIDAVGEEIHRKIKGGGFATALKRVEEAAGRWPGRIGTHLIVGLGETEEEMVRLIGRLTGLSVTIGLFAFTPVRGTALAAANPPDLASYRRVQACNWLLGRHLIDLEAIRFADGRVAGFGLPAATIRELLASGEAFQTAGCPDCNRPYYNERPGGVMYNYPRPLTSEEAAAAIDLVLSAAPGE